MNGIEPSRKVAELWSRFGRCFLDGLEHLFGDLRVQCRAAMKRNHDPSIALGVDPMATLDRSHANPSFNSVASASAAVSRGTLGMNFDGGGKNLLAQRRRPFIGG